MLIWECKVWKIVADREEFSTYSYTYHYESRYLFLILSVLLLCILDAHFTLNLLQLGGIEMNPFMISLLNKDVALSLILKYLMTAGGLIFLLVHKDFKIFGSIRVSWLIYFVFFLYVFLVLAEAYTYSLLLDLNRGLHF